MYLLEGAVGIRTAGLVPPGVGKFRRTAAECLGGVVAHIDTPLPSGALVVEYAGRVSQGGQQRGAADEWLSFGHLLASLDET